MLITCLRGFFWSPVEARKQFIFPYCVTNGRGEHGTGKRWRGALWACSALKIIICFVDIFLLDGVRLMMANCVYLCLIEYNGICPLLKFSNLFLVHKYHRVLKPQQSMPDHPTRGWTSFCWEVGPACPRRFRVPLRERSGMSWVKMIAMMGQTVTLENLKRIKYWQYSMVMEFLVKHQCNVFVMTHRKGQEKGLCDRWSVLFNFMTFWYWQQTNVSGDF